MKSKKNGFTLIETITVVVIIGVLAAFAIATFDVYLSKGRDSYRLAAVKNMAVIVKAHGFRSDAPNFADIDDDDLFAAPDPVSIQDLADIFSEQDYYLPKQEPDTCYLYGYESAPTEHDDFILIVGRNDTGAVEGPFMFDGTEEAFKQARNVTAITCDSGSEGVTGGTWTGYTWLNLTP